MVTLHFQNGVDRVGAIRKYRKYAIAQRFDDTAAMGFANSANPLDQSRDCLGRACVAHGLEDPCTTRQVGEYDSGVGAHFVTYLLGNAD